MLTRGVSFVDFLHTLNPVLHWPHMLNLELGAIDSLLIVISQGFSCPTRFIKRTRCSLFKSLYISCLGSQRAGVCLRCAKVGGGGMHPGQVTSSSQGSLLIKQTWCGLWEESKDPEVCPCRHGENIQNRSQPIEAMESKLLSSVSQCCT